MTAKTAALSNGTPSLRWSFVALLLIVAVCVRLPAIEKRTMSHPEMWAPLIPISSQYADPGERSSLPELLLHTLSQDTHPPGYYTFLWFWMKLFGSAEWAIRMPSVLFGAAAVVLVYWLGVRLIGQWAGLFAAVLLALNGHHVFWSQTARMYSMACLLGLTSTALLIRIEEGNEPRWVRFLYPAVMFAGASSHLFFWGVIAAHILWALGAGCSRGTLPRAFAGQTQAAILAAPFVSFAEYQRQNKVAEFSSELGAFWRDYLGFAFLIPTELSTAAYYETIGRQVSPAALLVATGICAIAGALLLLRAWWSFRRKAAAPEASHPDGLKRPPLLLWGASALLASLVILGFVLLREHQFARALTNVQHNPERIREKLAALQTVKLFIPLPFILMGLSSLAVYGVQRLRGQLRPQWLSSRLAVIGILAFVPLAIVSAVSMHKPLLNQRGAVLFAPYLLLLIGAGLASVRVSRPLLAGACLMFAVLHAASLSLYWSTRMDPVDFRAFASELKANMKPGDLVLTRRTWYGTPLLYYLRPGEHNIVVGDFDAAVLRNPQARVWIVQYAGTDKLQPVLAGRKHAGTVNAGTAYATLHVPAEPGSPAR